MYPGTQRYDGDLARWIPIEYMSYWDFARTFRVPFKGHTLVFDAPFLDLADEYSEHFIVYMANGVRANWRNEYLAWPIAHVVPADRIVLDETRKHFILSSSLAEVCARFEAP
jgi:hypothetical protein